MTDRPVYIDIDGTLTDDPINPWGPPRLDRISELKKMIKSGHSVVLWSGGGSRYAAQWAAKHGLLGIICLGKPEKIVDDNPDIRPKGRMPILTPEEFFGQ